jgi:hypothetical protein
MQPTKFELVINRQPQAGAIQPVAGW